MKVLVRNFHGSEVEVRFTFRRTTLYVEKRALLELFSQPEVVRTSTEKEMELKGVKYSHVNFTSAAERFLRPADLRVTVELLDQILKA